MTAAAEHDFAVLGVLHTNKTKTNDARERAMARSDGDKWCARRFTSGSTPTIRTGKPANSRVIAHDKCNVGRLARSLRMRLNETSVDVAGHPATLPRAELGEECDHRANDLVAAEASIDREKIGGKRGEAVAMLHELLADGPVAVESIKEEAGRREIGWRTVETAKGEIGVAAGHAGGPRHGRGSFRFPYRVGRKGPTGVGRKLSLSSLWPCGLPPRFTPNLALQREKAVGEPIAAYSLRTTSGAKLGE